MMFNAKIEKDHIVEWIKEYFKENHCRGAVLGISGGKDSGVVAGLLVEALGAENVIGLTLPCHSQEKDANLAKLVAKKYGFELLNLDLTPTFDTFVGNELFADIKPPRPLNNDLSFADWKEHAFLNSNINLKPRLRMAATYYMAALLSELKGGVWLVAGTGNAAEYFVGYSTKWGDAGYDFNPIKAYTVQEVIAIGEVIGVPPEVLYRTPDDGLSSMSDEDKMGLKYSDVHKIIRGDGEVSDSAYRKILARHKVNLHKVKPIPYPEPKTVKYVFAEGQ